MELATPLSREACEEAVAMLREGRAFKDVVNLPHFAAPGASAALLSLGSRIDKMRFALPTKPLALQLRTGDAAELRVELPALDGDESARPSASDSPPASRAQPAASPALAARGSAPRTPSARTPATHTPLTRAAAKPAAAQKRRRCSL